MRAAGAIGSAIRNVPQISPTSCWSRLNADITSGHQVQHPPRIDAVPASAKLPLGSLRPDGSIALLHDEQATIDELVSSLGT